MPSCALCWYKIQCTSLQWKGLRLPVLLTTAVRFNVNRYIFLLGSWHSNTRMAEVETEDGSNNKSVLIS
jgi:hypothetical protein